MSFSYRAWLEDCCVRLVCVLALDRFGDYVGDRAVSPVRETSAQVLAAVVRHMPEEIVSECVTALLELQVGLVRNERHVTTHLLISADVPTYFKRAAFVVSIMFLTSILHHVAGPRRMACAAWR